MSKEKYPKISDDPEVQKHYIACRKAGTSHGLSEMLATRKAAPYHNHMSPMHPRVTRGRGH